MCRPCFLADVKQRQDKRKDKKAEADRQYALKNKERIADYQAAYRCENRDKAKAYHKEYYAEVLSKDAGYRFRQNMRRNLSRSLARTAGKLRHLPYSIESLRAHIEKQFTKGMTWENYGDWHLDHIRPLCQFHIESPDSPDFLVAWAMSNLRPLWALENHKKNGSKIHLL